MIIIIVNSSNIFLFLNYRFSTFSITTIHFNSHINSFLHLFTAQANYDSKFLSGNLDYLLKMHSLRISDLEELLGVSAGYVSRTVNPDSKKRLSVDIVWKISVIFHTALSHPVRLPPIP